MYFKTTYFDELSKPIEVELICDKCGKAINILDLENFEKITSDYCIAKISNRITCNCGCQCQPGIIREKQNPIMKDIYVKNHLPQQQSQPICPTCGSTNIEKISTTVKMASAIGFGLFSKTARSQFKCKNCGYKW